jgi:hypothetical protein
MKNMFIVKAVLNGLFLVIAQIANHISGAAGWFSGNRSTFLYYDEDVNRDKKFGGASFDFRNGPGRKHLNPEGYQA